MPANPLSRFPVPVLTDLPEDIRARIVAVQDKAGFIPNVFLVLARIDQRNFAPFSPIMMR